MVTSEELRARGLSARAVMSRVRRGYLHRLHHGVFATGHANPPWEGRMLAAVKACGAGAALSHRSAAMLWGFLDHDPDRYPEVTVVGGYTRVRPGVRVHRTAQLAPIDRRRTKSVPVTSPARTLLDLAVTLDGAPLRQAVRAAQGRRLVSLRQIHEALSRLRPRRGCARLARAIATGPAPTKSVLESIVLDLFIDGGLVHPDVNQPMMIGGHRVIPDFRWPHQHLVVEADGAAWHDDPISREQDAERQAVLEAAGERVLRVTWQQALSSPRRTLTRVLLAGAPLGPRVG